MYKIAFLALDDIHHLHHILPIAFELSQDPDYDCVIYLQKHSLILAHKMAAQYPRHRCKIQILIPSLLYRCFRFHSGIYSARRIIRDHAKTLLTFDALLTPDMNLHELMELSRPLQKKPLFLASTHGPGDGHPPFKELPKYDYVLLCGKKREQIFVKAGFVRPGNFQITGYPKFDLVLRDFSPKLFADERPVCLYNPHSDLKVSSWEKWGLDILEFFYQNKHYNFLFAPHCNLFKRYLSPEIIPKKYFNAAHMLIDLGSQKSVDMTYTQGADIYLGDTSSQVYEFIRRPRPCIFLNSWQADLKSQEYWSFGRVISELSEFKKLFSQPSLDNPHADLQKNHFDYIFSISDESAGSRSAKAIKNKVTQSQNL